jgi:hypothetical protein
MRHSYPTPRDVGLNIPRDARAGRFEEGFKHALKGGHLTEIEYFRRSFRLGSGRQTYSGEGRHRGILILMRRASGAPLARRLVPRRWPAGRAALF